MERYNKPALDTPDLLALLKQRGLLVADEQTALNTLSIISYFRLACYFRPMETDKLTHEFRQGATLEQVLALYPQLCCIAYLLNAIDTQNTFATEFKALLAKYPTVDAIAMGFPNGWQQEPLWM